MAKSRLLYIDNLRIFLISLVVLHHFAITYGAPGGWYYNESQAGFPEVIPLAMFVAGNQAFFMGMFFFIAAFFIVPSLTRKGLEVFVKDRLIRLGIPTLIFYFLLSPFTVFIRLKFIEGQIISFVEVLKNGWGLGFGPMWFVEALLLFTAIYLLIRKFKFTIRLTFPSTIMILTAALLTGLLQFLIRIWIPVGSSHEFTNFQPPFFLQYIFLFALGIIACQNNWLESISFKTGRNWFFVSQGLIFIGFPVLFIFGGAAETGTEKFMGGTTWQSFAYAVWEQLVCFSMVIGLLGITKVKWNKQGKLAKILSESSYAVFVLHPPVLVGLSAVFLGWGIPQILKFITLAPLALIICFIIAVLFRKIPGVNKVL